MSNARNIAALSTVEVGATADQTKSDIEGLGIAASSVTGALPAISGASLTGVSQTTSIVNTAGQNWNGVTYTDPDAVGANPTAKIYPDGSVVGSTDNGKYTKWPNGDLECRRHIGAVPVGTMSNYAGSYRYTVSYTLPCASTEQHVATAGMNQGNGFWAGGYGNNSFGSIDIVIKSISNQSGLGGADVNYMAKGKWK